MHVKVINLRRATDRAEKIGARLGQLGVEFEFFPAVDGAAGEHLAFDKFRPELATRYGTFLSVGEAACFASHATLWQQCVEAQTTHVILEDDLVLDDEFPSALRAADTLLVRALDMVRLCGLLPRKHVEHTAISNYEVVRYLKGPSGTQGYAVSPRGAKALLAAATEWAEPVDDYIDRFWHHGLPPLALMPYRVSAASTAAPMTRLPVTSAQARSRRVRRLIDNVPRAIFNAAHLFDDADAT